LNDEKDRAGFEGRVMSVMVERFDWNNSTNEVNFTEFYRGKATQDSLFGLSYFSSIPLWAVVLSVIQIIFQTQRLEPLFNQVRVFRFPLLFSTLNSNDEERVSSTVVV